MTYIKFADKVKSTSYLASNPILNVGYDSNSPVFKFDYSNSSTNSEYSMIANYFGLNNSSDPFAAGQNNTIGSLWGNLFGYLGGLKMPEFNFQLPTFPSGNGSLDLSIDDEIYIPEIFKKGGSASIDSGISLDDDININGDKRTGISSSTTGDVNQDVRTSYRGTAEDLNKHLKGVLAGKGAKFIELQEKYGINAAFLIAIVNHESAHGSSPAARNKNNVAGMMDPKTKWKELSTFNSVEDCLEDMASNLKRNYINKGLVTIQQIQSKYCPVGADNDPTGLNKNWLGSITKLTAKYNIA